MTNDEKMKKLVDEAAALLTDIALNKSGFTSDHVVRAMEFVAKAKAANAATAPALLAQAA